MKALNIALSLALIASLVANGYLWLKLTSGAETKSRTPFVSAEPSELASEHDQLNEHAVTPIQDFADNAELATLNTRSSYLEQAKKLLTQGQLASLENLLQSYLRANPDDIEFLLLEAELIKQTQPTHYALAHYYELLAYPLSQAQRLQLDSKIDTLVQTHTEQLLSIQAWDILANFIEPLWQFAPSNESYPLLLAEAYARLAMPSAMENALASLLPDSPEVVRIRALLASTMDTVNESQPIEEDTAEPAIQDPTRGIQLARLGNHFLVPSQLADRPLQLMIDTGASTTAISQRAFNRIKTTKKRKFLGTYLVNTAGGQVEAEIYRFTRLQVGNYVVSNIAIIVLPLAEFDHSDGLLGMNFLREFEFRIDQQQAILYLQ